MWLSARDRSHTAEFEVNRRQIQKRFPRWKTQPFDFQAGVHARIQIYWCRSSIFRHLKLELLTQFPASNDEKYINVVYIWRKFVSFYGYVHWRMTTEISVMYGSEKVKLN